MTEYHRTRRWRGVIVVVLGCVAVGLLGRRPELVVLATVGVVYAAYPWLTSPPAPSLSIGRRVSDEHPAPGETFEVTTTIRNDGDDAVFDLRIVDGVPPALPVTDGTPRHGTALLPGEAATFQYTVEAMEGRHTFDPATVVARDASGEHEVELAVDADTAVECRSESRGVPLRSQTLDATGRIGAEQGGSGVEFYGTRAYRPGDPMKHIDWNRYARTTELTTIDFREEQAAAVVVVVDARSPCYRGITDEPHAVARCVSAAQQLLDSLIDTRNLVGLAAFGRSDPWIPPDTGRRHRTRVQRVLTDHVAFSLSPPDSTTHDSTISDSTSSDSTPPIEERVVTLERRLPRNAQVVLCTPLLDDGAVDAARRLDAAGHAVTVLSPDVTESGSPGRDLAALEREGRLTTLRRAEIPAVDWASEDSLAAALQTARPGVRA